MCCADNPNSSNAVRFRISLASSRPTRLVRKTRELMGNLTAWLIQLVAFATRTQGSILSLAEADFFMFLMCPTQKSENCQKKEPLFDPPSEKAPYLF
jgi:hypothetical protein